MDRPDATTEPPDIPIPQLGSYPARRGNRVRPLVDGVPALRRICQAVERAQRSVWVAVTFCDPGFQLPDGHGSLFDLLDRAIARGADARAIFWRPNTESAGYGTAFAGSAAERALLRARGSRLRIRWDRAHGAYCQHQKCWLVDAGTPSETAFVGGVNPTPGNDGVPGHDGEGQRHDLYLEIAGPCATDVHHNFVQRWNEASERGAADGTWGQAEDLPFPSQISATCGSSLVQIQRKLHPGRYRDGTTTPGGRPHVVSDGESTIREQYLLAIDAARRTIYIENQAVPIPEIADRLAAALRRGVEVVALVPAQPEGRVRAARHDPMRRALFDSLAALGRHERFTLAGIAGLDAQGGRSDVYVHAKAMLVDDAWATIGSCNLHASSMYGNSEMNAAIWDPEVVRAMRCQLLSEHLDRDTSGVDDREALALYHHVAGENRRRRDAGDPDWQGLAFALSPERYGA